MSSMTDADQVLASMNAVPDSENGTFVGVPRNDRSTRVKYWKKPDGRIALGPDVRTDPHMYAQYTQNKRWKELPNSFGNEQKNVGLMSPLKVVRGKEWRWLESFIAADGLTYVCSDRDNFGKPGEYLMPKEQLVELNLHRFPAIAAVRPDLADAVDLECPFSCPDENTGTVRRFSGVEKRFAQHSIDQHVAVAHKEAVASRAVGQAIAEALKTVTVSQAGGSSMDPATIAAIVAATVQALNPQGMGAVAAQAVQQGMGMPEPTELARTPDEVLADARAMLYGSREPNVSTGFELPPGRNDYTHNIPQPAKQIKNPAGKPIIPEGIPDEGWSRQAMMTWAKQNDLVMPERAFHLNTADWLQWIRDHLPTDFSTSKSTAA